MTKPQVKRTIIIAFVLGFIGYVDSGLSGVLGMLILMVGVIFYLIIMKGVQTMVGSGSGSWGGWDGDTDGDGGWDCGGDWD
jgi:hypothetical protein